MSNSLENRLAEIKKNQLTLIKVRGYKLDDADEEFLNGERDDISSFSQTYTKKVNRKTYTTEVYYLFEDEEAETPIWIDSVGKETISFLSNYEHHDETFTLIIIGGHLKHPAIKQLEGVRMNTSAYIEYWTLEQIMVNPLNHYMVPKHSIMTEEEIKRELPQTQRSAKIAKAFLSSMKGMINDPVGRWIGAREGDIVRIDQQNLLLNGITPEYRVVRKMNFEKA